MDFGFGPIFWQLLPVFVILILVATMRTISNSVAVQAVSWRQPRAVDFRAVQGSVITLGIGNLLSGLAGTVPNSTRTSSTAMIELTGVGARGVGIAAGALFIILSFIPKSIAVVLAVPLPVFAGYLTITMAILFVSGMKMVVQDGIDYRKGLVAGIGFWVGLGFQSGMISSQYVSEFAGGILGNGLMAGASAAILMNLFVELTKPRRRQLEMPFSTLPARRPCWRSSSKTRTKAHGGFCA